MDVPGYAPPSPTPLRPVMAVLPVLVSVVPASPPNDFAAPIETGTARFAVESFMFASVGAAREEVANNARIASMSTRRMVDFMVIDG